MNIVDDMLKKLKESKKLGGIPAVLRPTRSFWSRRYKTTTQTNATFFLNALANLDLEEQFTSFLNNTTVNTANAWIVFCLDKKDRGGTTPLDVILSRTKERGAVWGLLLGAMYSINLLPRKRRDWMSSFEMAFLLSDYVDKNVWVNIFESETSKTDELSIVGYLLNEKPFRTVCPAQVAEPGFSEWFAKTIRVPLLSSDRNAEMNGVFKTNGGFERFINVVMFYILLNENSGFGHTFVDAVKNKNAMGENFLELLEYYGFVLSTTTKSAFLKNFQANIQKINFEYLEVSLLEGIINDAGVSPMLKEWFNDNVIIRRLLKDVSAVPVSNATKKVRI